jgi:hypothetical protein
MSPIKYIYRWSMTLVMLVFIPLVSFKGTYKKQVIKWAVQKTSSLKIAGSSNVNQFACDVTGYYQTDTIAFTTTEQTNRIVPLKGSLTIDVASFDCHNRMLTKDLRKTLKSTEHPLLIVKFVTLDRIPVYNNNKDCVKGIVEIELAGVCKRFDIGYTLEKNGGTVVLNGGRDFSFSDFQLTPPKKLGGAIRVRDKFNVQFHLNLVQVN